METFGEPVAGASGSSDTERLTRLAGKSKEQAKELSGLARGRISRQAKELQAQLASRIDRVADVVQRVGGAVEGAGGEETWTSDSVRLIRRASTTLRDRSPEELVRDAGDQIRSRPGLVLVGFSAIGFLAARALKA